LSLKTAVPFVFVEIIFVVVFTVEIIAIVGIAEISFWSEMTASIGCDGNFIT